MVEGNYERRDRKVDRKYRYPENHRDDDFFRAIEMLSLCNIKSCPSSNPLWKPRPTIRISTESRTTARHNPTPKFCKVECLRCQQILMRISQNPVRTGDGELYTPGDKGYEKREIDGNTLSSTSGKWVSKQYGDQNTQHTLTPNGQFRINHTSDEKSLRDKMSLDDSTADFASFGGQDDELGEENTQESTTNLVHYTDYFKKGLQREQP